MDGFDPSGPLAALLGGGIILVIVWLLVTAAIIVLAIWITYTIIWRAVRRGMREWERDRGTGRGTLPPATGPAPYSPPGGP